MATPLVKSTYALDPETVRMLEALARQWGVSKSEALRRAIRAAAGSAQGRTDVLACWREFQEAVGLGTAEARRWERRTRGERRAASEKGEER